MAQRSVAYNNLEQDIDIVCGDIKEAAEIFGAASFHAVKMCIRDRLSGGMCQRVMIAMAMSCDPELLIADEPTTALDVTIQAQILELMEEIREKKNTGILMITHDLGVVAEMCSRVVVMYAGPVSYTHLEACR